MVDNVQLNSGTGGATLAADDIGGIHHQRVKVQHGADGSATDVSTASPMPVDLRADNLSGNLDVNLAASAATVTVDLGANNDVINAGTFAVQEDGAALTALQLIDDVVHVDDAAFTLGTSKGVVIMGFAGTQSVNANDAAALACDTDGALHISDGGNIITVDGTVTANLSATDNAVLDNIDTQTAAIQTAVEGTLTVGSHAVTNAGTFAVQVDGDALTALQLIDDIVYTDDTSTHATGTSKGAGIMAAATPTDGSVEANDIGMVAMSTDRRLHVDAQIVGTDAALDVSAATVTVDGSGVTQPVSGTVTANLSATDNAVLDAIQAAVEIMDDWDETNRAAVNLISGQAGIAGGTGVDGATVPRVTLATDVALPAGSNLIGDVGLSGARTSGGTTLYKNIDVDESEDQIKGTAGQVYWIHAMNLTAATLFLKFYNATAASVTVGTTVPDLTFPLATQGDTNGAGFTLSIPNGIAFGTAITIACTTGVADNDSGAPAANACVVNLGYA